jgi:parallel beta-helix repeat protein
MFQGLMLVAVVASLLVPALAAGSPGTGPDPLRADELGTWGTSLHGKEEKNLTKKSEETRDNKYLFHLIGGNSADARHAGDPIVTLYYVSTNGSDTGSGTASSPWRTIGKAMDANLRPGDEVVVRAGTYNESVTIDKDGSAAGYITLRSEVPGGARIVAPSGGANGIDVLANYVAVDGFDVSGSAHHGINGQNVHHVKVTNSVSHGNGASGISFAWSEFMTIEGNVTYKNASSGWFSGISVYQSRNITGDTSTQGFRTIVKDNVSYDNVTRTGAHTDGNGIIIDDFQSTQTSGYPNYTFPTLVENNLVYHNGGKGIQVTWSDNVTVRNNTAWHNNQDTLNTGTWRGELSNSQSSNNTWINNIAVADPSIDSDNRAIDHTSYGGYRNQNVIWANNLTFNGTSGQASVRTDGGNAIPTTANGNLLGVDPKFVSAPGDFHLQSGSPAVDAGTSAYGLPATDLDGRDRTSGPVDLGATEVQGSAPPASNTPPDAIDDQGFNAVVGSPIRIAAADLLANDTDPNGDRLTISGVSDASGGSAVLGSDGFITFLPSDTSGAGFTYRVSDGRGGADTARVTLSVQPAPDDPSEPPAPDGGAREFWDESVVPAVVSDPDRNATQLGVKFTSAVEGEITAIQFYKGPQNTGIHEVRLWNPDGDIAARARLDATSATGWIEVTFSSPVPIEAGEQWVATYHAPNGGYSVTEDYFQAPYSNEGLTIMKDGGLYAYGPPDTLPTNSYRSSNYWIDVILEPADGTPAFNLIQGTTSGERIDGTAGADNILAGDGADRLFGSAADDILRGQGGDDLLVGGEGADILTGGAGRDQFRFVTLTGSAPGGDRDSLVAGDGAMAFEAAGSALGDLIDLSRIDAQQGVQGNQAFGFRQSTFGGLSVTDIGGETLLRGNVDRDPAFEFEIRIADGDVLAASYVAGDFLL